MKRILMIAGGAFGLLLLLAFVVPFLVPAKVYTAQIERAASESLQREVQLAGEARLSVFPRISARVGGVKVANAEGFEGAHLIEAGELRGSVKWLPLLARRVEIEELSFVDARVHLQKKADGTVNWDLAAFKPKEDKSELDAVIGKAELRNAELTYSDGITGQTFKLTELNADASMKALDQPLKLKGDGIFQGEAFEVTLNLDSPEALSAATPAAVRVQLDSALGEANYTGTITMGEALSAEGAFTARSEALSGLVKFAGIKTDFDLAQLGSVNLKGTVSGPVETLKIALEEARQTSDLLKANFTGDLQMGAKPQINGTVSVDAPSVAALAEFAKLELPIKAAPLGALTAKAKLSGDAAAPELTIENAAVKSKLLAASYAGTVRLGKVHAINGTFKADVSKAGEVFDALGIKIEAPQLFEKLAVTGSVSGPADRLSLTGLNLTHTGTALTASYTGAVTLTEKPVLDGTVTATLPQAGDFARAMKIDLPAADAIERIEITGKLKGSLETLDLSGLDLKHSGALINAAFKGNMKLGGDGAVAGNFLASSQALRGLLKASGVEMAPGETLSRFSAKGGVNGSFKSLGFSALDLTLDDIKAKGTAGLDLRAETPRLTGALDMGTLDLSPFLGESDPNKPKSFGWSKEPLDLAGLKSANADLQIKTSTLRLGKVELTNATVNAKLVDGRLVADLPAFKAFNGDWAGKFTLDSAGGVPAVDFAMQGNSVAMSNLLGTLANFNRLDGTGSFKVVARGQGASIDAIMRALDGDVSTNLAEGALKGFNVAQAVRSAGSLREAIATGNLKNLDFGAVLTPSAQTDFTQFESVLKIQDGVANVDLMKLLNPVLGIDGKGKIDIGGQTIDIRLATAIDKKASGAGSVVQLNGIPVPVRVSGSWANLKITPDLSGVEAALKADAGGRVRDTITDRLGGAGGTVSDVIGLPQGKKPAAPVTPAPTDTPAPAVKPATPAPTPARKLEDAGRKAVDDALGGLLGKKKKPATPPPAPEPAPEPPPAETPAPEPAPPEPAPPTE